MKACLLVNLILNPRLDMHDSALVTFSAIACVLVLLPVSIHVRARNYATVFNIIWLFLMNLNIFINSVHFWDNSVNDIPVFCDICMSSRHTCADTSDENHGGFSNCALRLQSLHQPSISIDSGISIDNDQPDPKTTIPGHRHRAVYRCTNHGDGSVFYSAGSTIPRTRRYWLHECATSCATCHLPRIHLARGVGSCFDDLWR